MDNQNRKFCQVGTRECGLVCGVAGAVLALLLILFGFWNVLLIALLFGVGYFVGACDNKAAVCKTIINKFFPSKGE